MHTIIRLLPLLLLYLPGTAQTHRYQLITHVRYNGQPQPGSIAVCELTAGADAKGIPYEEVKWISMRIVKGSDTTDAGHSARAVQPYRISLHPQGNLALPRIAVADMTGPITDFHTFYVALGPKLGLASLKKAGDRFVLPAPLTGDFANGSSILLGNDCLQVSNTLTGIRNNTLLLKTAFRPPATSCLRFMLDEMNAPVVPDTLNNFQMVRPAAAGTFNVQWGREYFDIDSEVQQQSGRLLKAAMVNDLKLKVKIACDSTYRHCQREVPFRIERELELVLLQ